MTVRFVPKKELQGTVQDAVVWMRMALLLISNLTMGPNAFGVYFCTAISGGMDKLIVAWDFYKRRATQLISTGKT